MRLLLFDDRVSDAWHPYALTRPCGELLYGAMLLRERLERWSGLRADATLTRPWLENYCEAGAPRALARDVGPVWTDEPRMYLMTRAIPSLAHPLPEDLEGPALLRFDGHTVGCVVPAGAPPPSPEWFQEPGDGARLRTLDLAGKLLPDLSALVAGHPDRLAADLSREPGQESPLPRGVERIGDHAVQLGEDVTLEPGVLLDVRRGPLHLSDGIEVLAGTRLVGPSYYGPGCQLLGGRLATVAAGPRCVLRGEVEAAVILGYANKAHDGFVGHSYIGRWVNLGALTTTSDLKNTYGPVRIESPTGESHDTGLVKLGSFIGDHVKSAIGTLLNTGTTVGAGAQLFGGGIPPKWVEPFSWGSGVDAPPYRRDAFLHTAEVVLGRRQVPWDEQTRAWLGDVWDAARG